MLGRLLSSTALILAMLAMPALSEDDPAHGIKPIQSGDFYQAGHFDEAKVELGRLLFFDKILSGNRNIACATCHHPTLATADAVSLPLGEGAHGLGRDRKATAEAPLLGRVPRNSPALFFLGAKEFDRLYYDGRVEKDEHQNWDSGFWSPAREQLPTGLDNVLAVQAMFPVLSAVEMAGHRGENEIADAAALDQLDGPEGAWAKLAARLQAIPGYVERFKAAFTDVTKPDEITFIHAANAIAAFEASAFRPDDSPFDHYLETRDPTMLEPEAYRGMTLFYGKAGCSACHSGTFQTDQQFHAIGMPQIGPGKNDGFDQSYWQETGFSKRLEDFGRYRVTFDGADRYRFRTPTLRNVELTGPWGHSGAYQSLEDVVSHHIEPVSALNEYDVGEALLPAIPLVVEQTGTGSRLLYTPVNPGRVDDYRKRDGWVHQQPHLRQAIADANELEPTNLSDAEVADLVSFLKSLTDPESREGSDLVPLHVPSGLPVGD